MEKRGTPRKLDEAGVGTINDANLVVRLWSRRSLKPTDAEMRWDEMSEVEGVCDAVEYQNNDILTDVECIHTALTAHAHCAFTTLSFVGLPVSFCLPRLHGLP